MFCDHTVTDSPCPDGLTCGIDDRCYDSVQCDQRPIDAAVEDGTSMDGTDHCPGLGWLHFCPTNPRAGSESMPSTFNTSTMCTEVRQSPAGPLCVYAVTGSLTVSGNVGITGPRPLVLVANQITIEMSGILDVADGGAGAAPTVCAPPVSGGIGTDSVSGGAGGSFVSAGGMGGPGTTSPLQTPNPGVVPSFLRGGCPGGTGGYVSSDGMTAGGKGGEGGGAIYLLASQEIVMAGSIYAWGGGGEGGKGGVSTTGGGGGGGSGGHIVLDAPMLTLRSTAHLLAEGGGGGAGGARSAAGDPGMVIGPSPIHAAYGGAANGLCTECGAGGNGSFGIEAGSVGAPSTTQFGGAGGGGGGGGEIHWFYRTPFLDTGVISPPPVGTSI